jgi:Cu/Ag efflux protein CusF
VKKGAAVLLLGAAVMASAAMASDAAKSSQPAKPATPATQVVAKSEMAKGAITAIDAAKKTVTVKGTAATWTFETASTTKFYAAKKAAAWGDLKVGAQVSVHYQTKGNQKIASKISVEG